MDDLKTGDLIFFTGHTQGWLKYFSSFIQYGTHSNYSHIGMILKDPTFISPTLTEPSSARKQLATLISL